MHRPWWLGPVLVGCGFQHGSTPAGASDGSASDAAIDTLSATCTPAAIACDGRTVKTCGADGTWDPGLDHACEFTCAAGACVATSNIPPSAVTGCDASSPRLTPAANVSLIYTAAFGVHLDCYPDCGTPGVTRIDPVASITGASNVAMFCLSELALPAGVTLGVPGTGGPSAALALVVDGAVAIDGEIALDGGNAARSLVGGVGAPGGFDGADLGDGAGHTGAGPCGGGGGANVGSGNHWVGGGGGGAGGLTAGGGGGTGQCTQGNHVALGHAGADACGNDVVIPLVGGSGGGGGGDATINVAQGWPGGGGGGALQISSRLSIAVTGSIHARGGGGYGEQSIDGGGGGGAGGALLLEAPAVTISGTLDVAGGSGGSSGAGGGGLGGTGGAAAASGPSYSTTGQGGGGGGGSSGRIRVNAVGAACPTGGPCTAGPLVPQ